MIDQLIKEHSGDIMNMLTKNHGVSNEQASGITDTIVNSISGFIGSKAKGGQLDVSQLADLFNKNTPNQSNPLFSGISDTISSALSKSGVSSDVVSQISSGGLDEVLKIAQSGKLGNIDSTTVSTVIAALGGKGGGVSGLLGGLTNLFGKK